MSDLPPLPPGPDDDRAEDHALAAEFSLGLLEPDELSALESRLAVDPEFRALVARWGEDFATLLHAIPPVAPPPRVEAALMRRLFPEARQPLLRRLGLLPALVGGLLAALAVLWVTDLGLLRQSPSGPTYQATLSAEGGSLVVLARIPQGAGMVEIERTEGAAAPGRALELWLIPEGGTPVSLGVLPEAQVGRFEVPEDLRDEVPGAILAVTDEPPGGSPTGEPSGTPVALGAVTILRG